MKKSNKILFLITVSLFLLLSLVGCGKTPPTLSLLESEFEAGTQINYEEIVKLEGEDIENYTYEIQNTIDITSVGTHTLTYIIKDIEEEDEEGITQEVEITIVDTTPPVIEADEAIVIAINSNVDIKDFVKVSDNSSSEVTIEVLDTISTAALGVFPVNVKATDASGNEASVRITVNVSQMSSTSSDTTFNRIAGYWVNQEDDIFLYFKEEYNSKIFMINNLANGASQSLGGGEIKLIETLSSNTLKVTYYDDTLKREDSLEITFQNGSSQIQVISDADVISTEYQYWSEQKINDYWYN